MSKRNLRLVSILVAILFNFSIGTTNVFAYDKTYTAHMAGNAHIDTAWLWLLSESAAECNTTFSNAVNLMNSNADYRFSASAAQHYKWTKEYYPNLYSNIKQKVTNGQWEVVGGQMVEPDLNVPSGESLVRQSLYAQKFFKQEFGSYNKIGWVPDVFGFTGALPQILKKSGMDYFVTTKLNWNDTNAFPYEIFKWKGIDDSELVAYKPLKDYTNIYSDSDVNTSLNKPNSLGIKKSLTLYGAGDHGGGPTQSNINQIRSQDSSSGMPQVKMKQASDYFNSLSATEKSALPTWSGEMYLEKHRGTYTTQAAMKKYNRLTEISAEQAEKFSSLSTWLGLTDYPQRKISTAWDKILTNQFHDILPGSSIASVYPEAWDDAEIALNQLNSAKNLALKGIMTKADTSGSGIPLVVFNPLSFVRTDKVEADVDFGTPTASVKVYDTNNTEIPVQIMGTNGNTVKINFAAANIPSMGFKVYRVEAAAQGSYSTGLSIGSNVIENNYFRVEISSSTGNISRIFDKINNKEVLAGGEGNVLQVYNDTPAEYDAWDMDKDDFATTVTPTQINTVSSITMVESGPNKATYKVTKNWSGSTFNQYITLYSNINKIDIRMEADWNEYHKCLKVAFPFNVTAPTATYEIAYGAFERSTARTTSFDAARFEVPGHKWADLSNNGYGVSILNDSKYGWDTFGSRMRLTLLRSPQSPNNGPTADVGHHEFTYSIYPHSGDWKSANTVSKAYELNYPLTAVQTTAHTGSLGKAFSFMSINAPNVIISAVKKVEDPASNDLIVRLYESQGASSTQTTINFAGNIISASEVNLLEDYVAPATATGNQLSTTLGKYEIKTFRLSLDNSIYGNAKPVVTKVNLAQTYNIDVMSFDSARSDGNLDGNGATFSADLMPSEIVSDGIAFDIGPKTNGASNAVKALGQSIVLTAGNYNKLYLIGASAGVDATGGKFTVNYTDGSKTEKAIEFNNWKALIGGWQQQSAVDTIGYYLTHNHTASCDVMVNDNFLFVYSIDLDSAKTVSNVVLPNAGGIKILGMSLASGQCLPDTKSAAIKGVNFAYGKTATANQYVTNEDPAKAVDGTAASNSKWCSNASGDKWLRLDLGADCAIDRWVVKHAGAGGESTSWNTKDFKLQKSSDGTNWTDVDLVTGNTLSITDRDVTAFTSRYVRLYITVPTQNSDIAARIFEFELYGTGSTPIPSPTFSKADLSAYFNADGFSYDADRSNGDYDGGGYSYSANLVSNLINYDNAEFQLGQFADGQNNSINCTGQTIDLVDGLYSSIRVLGSSTNGDKTGTIRINYTDGTYSDVSITQKDWCASSTSGQKVVQTMAHRHKKSDKTDQTINNYLFAYYLGTTSGKTVTSITLPNNTGMHIVALTLIN